MAHSHWATRVRAPPRLFGFPARQHGALGRQRHAISLGSTALVWRAHANQATVWGYPAHVNLQNPAVLEREIQNFTVLRVGR
jgi:hypothetical protein